jgi:hypothetical protein
MKELILIQSELKAPKNQFNSFGKYKYRSCEDILEALKPLLKAHNCYLTLSDELVNIGDRYYIKATATITNSEKISESVNGFAREEESKKGMDGSQITGTSSSYSRKYALNGLFLIEDTKDSDATNTHDDKPQVKKKIAISEGTPAWNNIIQKLSNSEITLTDVQEKCLVTEEQRMLLIKQALELGGASA